MLAVVTGAWQTRREEKLFKVLRGAITDCFLIMWTG